MEYLHKEFEVGPGDTLVVTLNNRANVLMMDPGNFDNYRNGRPYQYHGGYATRNRVILSPPSPGRWHVVVNLGGGAGSVRAAVRVVAGKELAR